MDIWITTDLRGAVMAPYDYSEGLPGSKRRDEDR